MNLGLRNRTAIVGGGSAGIGLGIAQTLRAEGANVVLFSNELEELERQASELDALAVPGDQRVPEDLERVVGDAVAAFGGLDVLVLNGGGPDTLPATDVDYDTAKDAMDLMLQPVIHLTRLALPYLRDSELGRVIAVVSTSVFEPIDNLALSNMVRPAIVGWLMTLAREVGGSGVTVNAVAPGRIATRTFAEFYETRSMDEDLREIPLGRFGDPREVGDVVCFLASARAAYVSGVVMRVDGGLTRTLT